MRTRSPRGQLRLVRERRRIGPDRQPVDRQARRRADGDARVERQHALVVGKQRVDVEFGDLGEIDDELRQLQKRVDDGLRCSPGGRSR